MKIARGDRVRLTLAMAGVMSRGLMPRSRKVTINWHDRIGTVLHEPRSGGMIRIKFDDGRTDDFPIGALRHADGPVL